MPRVVLTHEGAVLKEYPLDKERITIGRKPHNDIQLDDPTVSGQHAAILMLQNAYVEDLNSTNGVLLNGKKVTRRQLNHGDMIKIGRHELKFIDDNAEEFESTVIIQPEGRAAAPAAPPAKRYQVKILSGPKSGESINLIKPYTTLGSPGVQVAVVARRGKEYFLMPMSGTGERGNPPKLNGQSIGANSQRLKEGDTIEVAGTQLQFAAAD
ncbi:MAG: FHA domain-containing protein [Halobacteria archaeon]|nr:FHA domain-containing protein [Halobacteria archaeon]